MIAAPWDVVLTVLFAATFLVCAAHLVRRRRARGPEARGLDDAQLVDVNHAVMSVSMIAMAWLPQSDVVLWAQLGLFGIFALALIPTIARATSARARIDAGSHVVLDAAMMWMLGAMPLLMAGPMAGGMDGGAHAAHGGAGAMLEATPTWATVVNVGAAAASAAVAAWWLWRAASARGHRIHAACHAGMAGGMAAMLLLMD